MNAEQILALAGVFQAASLAHALAHGGDVDDAALTASLNSVFKIDATDVRDVFAGFDGVRLGLGTLIVQIDQPQRDLETMRLALGMLRLERKLHGRSDLQEMLLKGIEDARRQLQHFSIEHPTISARLGELYEQTISTLRPRIMVSGDPRLLQQSSRVARIRAVLLAGVRAAVLWQQVGGRKWQLLLQRKQIGMLARGLQTRVTLDHGE